MEVSIEEHVALEVLGIRIKGSVVTPDVIKKNPSIKFDKHPEQPEGISLLQHVKNLLSRCLAGNKLSQGAPADSDVVDEDLFLTPLIKAGKLKEAREKSEDHMDRFRVQSSIKYDLKSHSGYLTVDEANNANVFFWFFPAQESPQTASVILWANEASGYSCMRAVFLENGPFFLDEKLRLHERNHSWAKTHSMLYIDVPVGAGFSFTDKEEGYAKNKEDEAQELYEALKQFYTIFPEYHKRDLFIAGELLAVQHVPQMVEKIEAENEKNPEFQLNLKGIIFGSPIFDVAKQTSFGQYFYDMNLIEEDQLKTFQMEEDKMHGLIREKKYPEAEKIATSLVVYPRSLYETFTGLTSPYNILQSEEPRELERFSKFIDSRAMHKYLHVGLHNFTLVNFKVHDKFSHETMSYDGKMLENLLNKGKYRILIYSAQFDAVSIHTGVTKAVEELNWNGQEEFLDADRKVWKVGKDVAGYVKKAGVLTYVMVRNSGRYIMMDNPEWGHDLIEIFTSGKDF
ncbi:unnamed protein product [Allacma fusca]|uniref:Uncharacterized protein n=1 Tax=Allacma fusca TaxID=39272 RepID=A0A8J2NN94_9HEXA|nr:unnamed protein product [Allacma fusca]